jgi:hypothetical protein
VSPESIRIERLEMAPQSRVGALAVQIAVVLDALGHPEALVTDLSSIGDFYWCTTEEDAAALAALRERLGVPVRMADRLVDVAARLRRRGRERFCGAP